jgi:hypothetical protein
MGFEIAIYVIAGAGVALAFTAERRDWRPPLVLSIVLGLAVRTLVVVLSRDHTPHDVAVWFRGTGEAVRAGHDPLRAVPAGEWNFLPFVPYLHALELATRWQWTLVEKTLPVLADCTIVVLVARLARERPLTRAFQYAMSPIAVLVSALHGQIDPIALAFGLGALVAARSRRPVLAGMLLGLGIATKSWPVLFLPGVLFLSEGRRWRALAASAAVPLLFFLTMPLAFDANLAHDAGIILKYRSIVGWWGWTGIFYAVRGSGIRLTKGLLGTLGAFLTLASFVVTLWLYRKRDPIDMTLALLLVFLVVTAGFGTQYVLWSVPLIIARAPRWGGALLVLGAGWVVLNYVPWTGAHPGIAPSTRHLVVALASIAPFTAAAVTVRRHVARRSAAVPAS